MHTEISWILKNITNVDNNVMFFVNLCLNTVAIGWFEGDMHFTDRTMHHGSNHTNVQQWVTGSGPKQQVL